MIKIFRKIRYDLMKQNKTGKPSLPAGRYFKYAIGEIILVVIGILIALQINTWNESRKEHIQETQLLKSLKKEYFDNLNQLNDKIYIRNKIIHSANELIKIIENKKELNSFSIDSIETYIGITTIFPTFNASSGVTNDIINSGKLHIIEDNELRVFLSNWSGDISQVTEMENVLLDYYINSYHPFLVENIQLRNSFNAMLSVTNLTEKFNLNKSIENVEQIAGSKTINEYEALFNNEDFEDYLVSILSYSRVANIQSEGFKVKIKDNLKRIENNL